MAAIERTITVGYDYRPCYADGKKALFHKWTEESKIIPPSPMIGGHNGGVLNFILAVVEYEDGTIEMVEPSKIQFCDNKMNEYAF